MDKSVGLGVRFIFDLTNDFLQNIFDGHQSSDAAVLIDNNGHVITLFTKLPQQYVKTFTFWNHHRGAQHICYLKRVRIRSEDLW